MGEEQPDTQAAVDRMIDSLQENEVADLIMEHTTTGLSGEPRTIRGTFPGDKTRAMEHASVVVEMCEDDGLEAEREYTGEKTDQGLHIILIHIEGGDEN